MSTKKFLPKENAYSRGVSFYITQNSIPNDVDTVEFYGFSEDCVIYQVHRNVSFPNVKKLILKDEKYDLRFTNMNFPNVEWVESENPHYPSGKYLVKNGILLNAFCQTPDAVIDMKGITGISEEAFVGCQAKSMIHDEDLEENLYFYSSFINSGFLKSKPVNGKIKAGRIVIQLDPKADKVLINDPKEYCVDEHPKVEEAVQHRDLIIDAKDGVECDTALSFYSNAGFRSIILKNFKEKELSNISFFRRRRCTCAAQNIILENCSGYTTIDGLLYTNSCSVMEDGLEDGLVLLNCPTYHSKDVILPDNCVGIERYAFINAKVDSIFIPKSVRYIGTGAFFQCEAKKIIFEEGMALSHIPSNCFERCTNLERIRLPKIKCITSEAFLGCINLKEVILPEGLEKILDSVFSMCGIFEITLPESLYNIQEQPTWPIKKVTVKNQIPWNLLKSLIVSRGYPFVYDTLEITDGKNHVFLPKIMSEHNIAMFTALLQKESPFKELDKLKPLYRYGKTPESQQDTAFQEFKSGDKRIENYLRKYSKDIVIRYAKDNMIDDAVFLIKNHLLSREAIEKLIEINDNPTITAYLLDEERENHTQQFSL